METGKSQSLRLGSKTRTLVNQDLGESLGKVPPQAIDLEEAVLGALMLEKDALTNVIDILKPQTFYKDSHKVIYETIVDLFNNSERDESCNNLSGLSAFINYNKYAQSGSCMSVGHIV